MEKKLGAILCWMELKQRTHFEALNGSFSPFFIRRSVFGDVCTVTVLRVFGTQEVLANKASSGTTGILQQEPELCEEALLLLVSAPCREFHRANSEACDVLSVASSHFSPPSTAPDARKTKG